MHVKNEIYNIKNSKLTFLNWKEKLFEDIKLYKEDINWYLALDASGHEDLVNKIHEAKNEIDFYTRPLFLNTYNDKLVSSGPQLITLKTDSKFCNWVIDLLETIPLAIVIGARPNNHDILYEHLQNIVEYKSDNNGHMLFRFYDPRILYGLTTYQEKTVKDYIINNALFFEAWEPGRAEVISLESSTSEITNFSDGYKLPEDLMEHLWQEAHIHSVIGGLEGEAGDILRNKLLPQAYKLINEAANIIKKHGYTSYEDLGICASLTALMGINFWKNENLLDSIKNKEKNYSLADALDKFLT